MPMDYDAQDFEWRKSEFSRLRMEQTWLLTWLMVRDLFQTKEGGGGGHKGLH